MVRNVVPSGFTAGVMKFFSTYCSSESLIVGAFWVVDAPPTVV